MWSDFDFNEPYNGEFNNVIYGVELPEEYVALTGPYKEMGKAFVTENGFKDETVKNMQDPNIFHFLQE